MTNTYKITTVHGYDFFEVSSAFQKAVRRCDEEQAMYWGVELYESNYQKYLWKRMVIMASEDIGLAADTITLIMSLKQSFDFLSSLKEKSQPERLPFTHAVLALVRANKSRFVDCAIFHYWNKNTTERLVIPDYALDMHTRRGKAKGRGIEHFVDVASHLENHTPQPNESEWSEELKVILGNHNEPKPPKATLEQARLFD